jgi:ferredoxin
MRWHVRRLLAILEHYSSRFFGADNDPFGQSGALVVAALAICVLTGVALLFFYVPTPESAAAASTAIQGFPLGGLLLGAHRMSADLLILIVLFHLLRVWATERFRGPRARAWVKGLIALPLLGLIGWSGQILPWNGNALVLASWGKELAGSPDRWPILGWLKLGTLISLPIFSAGNEADLILRVFALHVGGAILLVWLVMRHLSRVTPPRVILPTRAWLVLIAIVLVTAQLASFDSGASGPFNPFAPPQTVRIDLFATFPLLFYPLLGAPLLSAIIVLVLIGLVLLPKLEPQKILVAVVNEAICTGCRLCMQDCPYGAIVMVPQPNPAMAQDNPEIPRILPGYCNACGTCVGSCEVDAIELPDLQSKDIVDKIDRIVASGKEASNAR